MQSTNPLVQFVQVMSWLRGTLQPADLTLRQSKSATNLCLGEHWPMLMAVGVEHLTEMPGFQRVS